MNEDKTTTGGSTTTVNPGLSAPASGSPVMDVTPPPAVASESGEAPVVAAPPEETESFAISDDIAEQIAADSTMPPQPEPAPASPDSSLPEPAPQPEQEPKPAETGGAPSDLIQGEINRDEAAPAAAVTKTPKVHNPARTAVVMTVIIMVILAGLAVFAYMSSQN